MNKSVIPQHVAIIMDGNGRWAQKRGAPRAFGHRAGRQTVDRVVSHCAARGVKHLTLFAFSTENWRRPATEVALLMRIMAQALRDTIEKMVQNDIRLKVLGNREQLTPSLQKAIAQAERETAQSTGMNLVLALNYSGRWAILEAARRAVAQAADPLDEARLAQLFPEPHLPDVDLLIRSSGELRLSNFLLWELAYAELYFTPTLWPDMDEAILDEAFAAYAQRDRRFGALPLQEQ